MPGTVVSCVHSAENAIESVTRSVPDAMLLDLQLPGMNGIELLDVPAREAPGRSHALHRDERPRQWWRRRQLLYGCIAAADITKPDQHAKVWDFYRWRTVGGFFLRRAIVATSSHSPVGRSAGATVVE